MTSLGEQRTQALAPTAVSGGGTGPAAPVDELPGLVRRGVGWTMASQGAMQVMALLTSIVVARFLSPHQVGLASEAVVFVSLTLVVADFGFGAVVVQREQLSEVEVSTLFWAVCGIGLILTLFGVAISGLIADLYNEHEVQPLFAVMAITFLVTAPGIIQGALLTRELRFRNLELRTIVATVTSCTTAIVLAALGAGPWAIVAQTIAMAGISTALLWRSSPWRPRFVFSFAYLRDVREYAGHVLGSKLVIWANQNVDNLLVGRFLGAAPLGAYSLAFAVALTPVNRIAMPVTQVFFPAFSRMREKERIAEVWLRSTRILAVVVVPAMLGLVIVGPDFVRAVFGYKWRHAGPVMQLLAAVALLQTLTSLNDVILAAIEETRLLFRFRTVVSVLTLVGFAAGLPWGITGASAGYLIACLVLHPLYVWLTVRALGITLATWVHSVLRVFVAGALMLGVILGLRILMVHIHNPVGVRLLVTVVAGAIVYGYAVAWLVPEIPAEVREMLARRRGERVGG
jgi:O-antigen/teichoic acid export membrane protein